jgi:thiol-disulfide isomerase/thioredoxin
MLKKLLCLFILIGFVLTAKSQRIPKWRIEDVVKSFTNKSDTVYVVNFWATFCKPCNEEIPDFIRIVKKYEKQKVKLLLVSLDLPSYYAVKLPAFIKKNKYNTNHVWLNETDADRFCPAIDEKWSGAIPSTIIVNNKTGYRKFIEDQVSAADFEAAIKEAIGGNAFKRYVAPMNDAEVDDDRTQRSAAYVPKDYVTFKSTDSAVYSITEGKVNMVVRIDNMKVVIIENAGLYYTYSNLGSTIIKKGDIIKKDQLIGYASSELYGDTPTLELYVNNSARSILLTKANFTPRKDKRQFDYFIDSPKEPQ